MLENTEHWKWNKRKKNWRLELVAFKIRGILIFIESLLCQLGVANLMENCDILSVCYLSLLSCTYFKEVVF